MSLLKAEVSIDAMVQSESSSESVAMARAAGMTLPLLVDAMARAAGMTLPLMVDAMARAARMALPLLPLLPVELSPILTSAEESQRSCRHCT